MVHFDDTLVSCSLQRGSLNVEKVELSVAELPKKVADSPGAQVARYLLKHVSEELHAILTQEGPKDARVSLVSHRRRFHHPMRFCSRYVCPAPFSPPPRSQMVLQYIGARACIVRQIRHEIAMTSLRYPVGTRTVLRNGSHHDSILELDVDVFATRTRQGFSVVVPLSASEVLEPAIPEDWAKGISTNVRAHFGTNLNALALSQTVNDRLEGGSGRGALVDAIVAAEDEANRPQ